MRQVAEVPPFSEEAAAFLADVAEGFTVDDALRIKEVRCDVFFALLVFVTIGQHRIFM